MFSFKNKFEFLDTEKKKVIRFSEEVQKIDPIDNAINQVEFKGFNFAVGLEQEETLSVDFEKWKESTMSFSSINYEDTLDEEDIDRYVLKEIDGENWKPILKKKLNLPNFDEGNVGR